MEFFNKRGQVIGKMFGDTFTKRVQRSKHFFRKYHGWGVDSDTLAELDNLKCRNVRIIDEESDVTYEMLLKDFLRLGETDDYGHGQQMFVDINEFKII